MATSKKKPSTAEAKEKKTDKQEKVRTLPGFFSFSNKKFVVLAAFIFAFAAFGSYRLYTTRAASSKVRGVYACYQQRPLLKSGSRGSCVTQLQHFYNHVKGVEARKWQTLQADGIFGPATQDVTRRFQQFHNQYRSPDIAVDGAVGPQTWEAIRQQCTKNNDEKFYCGWPVTFPPHN